MRTLVLVTGAPGSGKTTLAVPFAAHLGVPLLTKDTIAWVTSQPEWRNREGVHD